MRRALTRQVEIGVIQTNVVINKSLPSKILPILHLQPASGWLNFQKPNQRE